MVPNKWAQMYCAEFREARVEVAVKVPPPELRCLGSEAMVGPSDHDHLARCAAQWDSGPPHRHELARESGPGELAASSAGDGTGVAERAAAPMVLKRTLGASSSRSAGDCKRSQAAS